MFWIYKYIHYFFSKAHTQLQGRLTCHLTWKYKFFNITDKVQIGPTFLFVTILLKVIFVD